LLYAAMSEVWDGRAVAADGGVRARNQQRAYVDRVAARQVAGRGPAPVPAKASAPGPSPTFPGPAQRNRPRHGWQLATPAAGRGTTAQPA
ncbi:MAG: fliA, partial [Modestobacter sp.]|nr:fliA [Modestobacter sp.]